MKTPKNTDFLALKKWMIKMVKWENQTPEVENLIKKYYIEDEETNTSPSFAFCTRNKKMQEILLEIIEKFDGEICNHFTDKKYTKKSAREYVLEYKE